MRMREIKYKIMKWCFSQVKENYCADVSGKVNEANAMWTAPLSQTVGSSNALACKEGFMWDTNDSARTINHSLICVPYNSSSGHWLYAGYKFHQLPPYSLLCKRNSFFPLSFFFIHILIFFSF